MDLQDQKPFIANDKEYAKKVRETIKPGSSLGIIEFERLNELLELLGISENPYDSVSAAGFDAPKIQEIFNAAFNRLNAALVSTQLKSALEQLWDYLAEEDPLEHADLIFVFGGLPSKPIVAAELYKQGWSQKVMFSGRHASYMTDVSGTEAELFARIATENGVPQQAIILEKEAINTPENAVFSAKILKQINFLPSKIIIITNHWHLRRAFYTFKTVLDWNPKIIRRAAPEPWATRENYYQNKTAFDYVVNEYIKIYGARKMGHF